VFAGPVPIALDIVLLLANPPLFFLKFAVSLLEILVLSRFLD
jgi:hypothetical protein